ncbi:DUF2079 domain-containing protein [Leptospira selangorensis]|uniref:DUF2079 domain-containing protein n=1 Tax=Leptospira selangorensis TaxID=2484982 RepID=UPI0010836653|nr:DUF2079 domain-containing protein [Leptospira selangorensis]TGK04474.1 DUF2079 domain-containing protein [Leptospira selangorensis]
MNLLRYGTERKSWILFLASLIYLITLSGIQYATLQIEWHDSGSILYALATPKSVGYFWSYEFGVPFLQEHCSYILGLLSFLFHFFPYLELWLIIQCISISLGIVLLERYFSEIIPEFEYSWVLSLTFLLNPYVTHAHLYPHFENLWIPLFSGFLLYANRGSFLTSLPFLILALMVKEDAWIYAIGATSLLFGRVRGRTLIFYFILILLYVGIILFWFTPTYFPDKVSHFSDKWGKSKSEILIDLFQNPFSYLKLLISGQFKYLFVSVLCLPIFSGWRAIPGIAVAGLWMSSVSQDRAFFSFYFGLPAILLFYYSIPFAISNLSGRLAHFGKDRRWILLPTIGLILVSIFLLLFPGNYSGRGPTVAKLIKRGKANTLNSIQDTFTLVRLRSGCEEKVFASFSYAAYLFCGNDIKMPYHDLKKIESGVWYPDLIVLRSPEEELVPASKSVSEMALYFDKNPLYRKEDHGSRILVWRKIVP